ncbi:MAG: hypothetical protein IT454_18190 [Planctomycetes bacterium]|nr:hypothetical protein [Planctomycetota bacterium]
MSGDRYTPFTSEDEARSIEHALERLPTGLDALSVVSALRRELAPDTARRAAELHELRSRATERFPSGRLRFLTREGLEQATREVVARLRAQRIAELSPGASVYDATCGLGADALALAEAGLRVIAGELDPLVARCARANLAPYSNRSCVILADAMLAPVSAAFLVIDPDRRAAGRRVLEPQRWSPPLASVLRLCARFRGACVKLSPAFDIGEVGALESSLPHGFQWVSVERELCETNLWTGEWASAVGRPGEREAVTLDGHGKTHRITGHPFPVVSDLSERVSGNCWLLDPDPAVVRSGLLGRLAFGISARGLDPQLAYLLSEERPSSPWVRGWRVLETSSADPKRVREALRRHDIGPVQVLKRGHPEPAEVLERRFRGPGQRRGLLAVARIGDGHRVFLLDPQTAERVSDTDPEPPPSRA